MRLAVRESDRIGGGMSNWTVFTGVVAVLALGGCEAVRNVIVYRRTAGKVAFDAPRDLWLDELTEGQAEANRVVADLPHWPRGLVPVMSIGPGGITFHVSCDNDRRDEVAAAIEEADPHLPYAIFGAHHPSTGP